MSWALRASTPVAVGQTTSATTVAATLGAAVVSNDIIIVGVECLSSDTVSGVADDLGNSYTPGPTFADAPFLNVLYSVFTAPVTATGTPTITATFGAATTKRVIHAAAFSGGLTSGPVDQNNNGSAATGTVITSGTMTPTQDNELIWGMAGDSNNTPAVAGAFTSLAAEGNWQTRTEYLIQTTATGVTTNYTALVSAPWSTIGVTFKVAGGGGPVLDADYLIYQVVQP